MVTRSFPKQSGLPGFTGEAAYFIESLTHTQDLPVVSFGTVGLDACRCPDCRVFHEKSLPAPALVVKPQTV